MRLANAGTRASVLYSTRSFPILVTFMVATTAEMVGRAVAHAEKFVNCLKQSALAATVVGAPFNIPPGQSPDRDHNVLVACFKVQRVSDDRISSYRGCARSGTRSGIEGNQDIRIPKEEPLNSTVSRCVNVGKTPTQTYGEFCGSGDG